MQHALAAREAGEKKTILFNLSGHGIFDMAAYEAFLAREDCHNEDSGRGVAQPGSAPALGAGGRWFESSRPDQIQTGHPERGRRVAPTNTPTWPNLGLRLPTDSSRRATRQAVTP